VDGDPQPAELDAADDPGQRLARPAPLQQRGEPRRVAVRAQQQLVGLLVGGDEAVAFE
jgi:hypothetical protein